MWLFLWVIFVLCAAGFFIWSYHTIYEQKKAWKAYAAKMNLTYNPGQFLESPTMSGEIKGHLTNFYPQLVQNTQGQKSTQTVIEVFLNTIPPMTCVVTSAGFSDFIAMVDLPETFTIDDQDWPKNVVSRSFDSEAPMIWFKEDRQRISAIQQLSKLPFNFAFVADGEQCFIAVRTANPITDPRKLNQLVTKLIILSETLQGGSVVQPTMANPKEDKNTVEPEMSAPSV